MKLERIKDVLLSLIAGIPVVFCLNCTGNTPVIDHNKLAAQYFIEDTQWYLNNIPFFECSDKQIEEVYYYRWKLYKAHVRNVGEEYGYVITEFINDVSWDIDPYCSINCGTAHHIYEGRWLKNNRYLDGYIDYMYRGGGNRHDRQYSEGIADAVYARYLVNSDSAFVEGQLGMMEQVYKQWDDKFDSSKKLYFTRPISDGSEYTISAIDASGGIKGEFGGSPYTTDGVAVYDKGAQGAFWDGEAFRPTINSYMYGNALAISRVSTLKGDTALSRIYLNKANSLKTNLQGSLWNSSFAHFTDRYKVDNKYVHYWDFISGRELAGFVPWMYNMPDNTPAYNNAWKYLIDTTKFMGNFGLRTVEPSYPWYMKYFKLRNGRPDCQWNGASWPFQTAQVLTAMANLLDNYTQDIIKPADYLKVLRLYTGQHYYNDGEKNILNLQEDYNPETGQPITYGRDYGSHHYNHSTYNDLVITGLCGIRPSEGNALTIHPLTDSTIQYFCLEDVMYHGHTLTLAYDADGSKYKLGKGLTVIVDGKKVSVKETNGKYEVAIGTLMVKSTTEQPIDLALNIRKEGFPVPSASVNSVPDSLYQAIDGRSWYFPEVKNHWSTFGSTSSTDWYALDFGQSREVSSVKLCLYADGKTYGAPEDYNVEYLNEGQWLQVKVKERKPVNPVGNTINTVVFDNISTNQIRIKFKTSSKQLAVAISELEFY